MAKIFGARTVGANIKPTSRKNLKLFKWFKDNKQKYIDKRLIKEFSEEEREKARERFIKTMEKTQR